MIGHRTALGFAMLALTIAAASGCSDKKKKAAKVINEAVEECRASDETFHEVKLLKGAETQEVLTATCEEELGEVKMVDEFSAETELGPYLWRAGLDQETGIWTMQSVDWETLSQARKRLGREGLDENVLKHAEKQLAKAQQQYPESSWIRLERLDIRLRLRTRNRDLEQSGLELGDEVTEHLEETLQWARDSKNREAELKAQLRIVDYYLDFLDQVASAREAMGSQDVQLKRSAELAEEEGNTEAAEEYRTQLEKLKEERPEKKERFDELTAETESLLCERIPKLSPEGIEDSALNAKIEETKNRVDCEQADDEASDDENDGGP